MLLHTIQPLEVLSVLEREKVLDADPTQGDHWDVEFDGMKLPGYQEQYEWLKQQMHQRVADYHGENLWWAWIDKPDLRSEAWRYPKGETYVCLALVVPESRVLVSDFDRWGDILNNGYISYTEEQEERWEAYYTMSPWEEWKNLTSEEKSQRYYEVSSMDDVVESEQWKVHTDVLRKQSWESIFDTNGYGHPRAKEWVGDKPIFQATFGQLRLEEVKGIRTFKGRQS